MSSLSRRPGTEEDREFLYDLIKSSLGEHIEATYGPWDEAWQRENFAKTTRPELHEILELADLPIGCLLVEPRPDCVELHRVLLLPAYQHQGLGAQVVAEVLAHAQERGLPVRLQVFRMSPAKRFYERLGFVQIAETETHYVLEHAA